MATPRAIKATFSNWRPVMGRKVLQLIFEVPIEQQGEVLTMLGMPDEKWCAIALLNQKGGEANNTPESIHSGYDKTQPQAEQVATPGARPKRAFKDLSLPEQAGILALDGEFGQFLMEETGFAAFEGGSTADYIRSRCEVTSRSELSTNRDAANKWRKLVAEFEAWKTDRKYAEVMR